MLKEVLMKPFEFIARHPYIAFGLGTAFGAITACSFTSFNLSFISYSLSFFIFAAGGILLGFGLGIAFSWWVKKKI